MWTEAIAISSLQELGGTLARRRLALGLSQKRLFEMTGVEPSTISRLERAGDDSTPVGAVIRLFTALELDLELRPHGSKLNAIPPQHLSELGLSPRTMEALRMEGLESIDQLDSANAMLARPVFRGGTELYEIICALTRNGLALPTGRIQVPSTRNHEILRLRIVEGLTLGELAKQYRLHTERIRQILNCYGLTGVPPAASLRRRHKRRTK